MVIFSNGFDILLFDVGKKENNFNVLCWFKFSPKSAQDVACEIGVNSSQISLVGNILAYHKVSLNSVSLFARF